ncbi:MFS transporter [Streptomyces hygroscopicus]|uniref:MFS transporter n=1 Tax=Streptomyces hygroscopicus TaxID=1912 RepID=UPI0007DB3069|nr:MFS transporter [Streptomyces sp. NBRC 109436]
MPQWAPGGTPSHHPRPRAAWSRQARQAAARAEPIVAGAGLLLSAAASSVPGLLGLYGILATLGFSAASGVTAGLVVRHWFTERRGLAFGLVESGFGAGQFVFTPLSLFLIEAYGWRTTLVIEGILLVAAVGPSTSPAP